MTLATRRILYISFILAFFIITPLVISYAAGYQFVLGSNRPFTIKKTGMLILNSDPQGAKIYINGELQQEFIQKYLQKAGITGKSNMISTPAKIKNLLPGDYDVTFELDGYWKWQKKLTVKGGESTYAEDVHLFKNSLPLSVSSGPIKDISVSYDEKYLLTSYGEGIELLTQADDSVRKIGIDASGGAVSWSQDSRKFIAGNFAYDIADNKIINLAEATKGGSEFRWDPENNNQVYFVSGTEGRADTLFRLRLSDLSAEKVLSAENIAGYLVKDGLIYLINKIGEAERMEIYRSASSRVAQFDLSKPYDYRFVNSGSRYINLFNEKQRTLYLIDPQNKFQIAEALNNLSYATWVDDNRLLYNNDFEIWLVDLKYDQKLLLTRISSPINKVVIHPSKNYIIFSTDNSLNTIELDDRDRRIITELLKLDKISSPYLDKRGEKIYFYARVGSHEGLYKLSLK